MVSSGDGVDRNYLGCEIRELLGLVIIFTTYDWDLSYSRVYMFVQIQQMFSYDLCTSLLFILHISLKVSLTLKRKKHENIEF